MHKFFIVICLVHLLVAASAEVAFAQPVSNQRSHHKLVVAVVDAPPFSMKDEAGNWTGFSVDLWKRIAHDLNLDYELKETDLVGLLKGIEDRSFDAAATGIYVTSARESKFDYSHPFFVSNVTIATNSDQVPSLWFVFRSTLFNWNFLGLMLLIVAVALLGATLLWLLEQKGSSAHYVGKHRKAFGKSLFWSIMVLSGKEFPKSIGWSTEAPTTLFGKLFGVVWTVVGIMTISLFTASVASVLTSKQLQSVINSPNDLQHVRVGTVVGSTDHGLLERLHIKHVVYSSPLELVKALSEHKIDAAVYGEPILRYYSKHLSSNNIVVLRFSLEKYFVAIPLPAGSELRKPINISLLKTIESKEWQTILADYMGSY